MSDHGPGTWVLITLDDMVHCGKTFFFCFTTEENNESVVFIVTKRVCGNIRSVGCSRAGKFLL